MVASNMFLTTWSILGVLVTTKLILMSYILRLKKRSDDFKNLDVVAVNSNKIF